MVDGVQCVMMDGMILMLVWCVDNWDIYMGQQSFQLVLVKDQDQFGWVVLHVLVVN